MKLLANIQIIKTIFQHYVFPKEIKFSTANFNYLYMYLTAVS